MKATRMNQKEYLKWAQLTSDKQTSQELFHIKTNFFSKSCNKRDQTL